MQRPNIPNDDRSDKAIKNLLLSHDPDDRVAGLEMLDAKYRLEICGYIRTRYSYSLLRLDELDLGDVWQTTLITVYGYVESGTFKYDGSLQSYLRMIANSDAIDLIRKLARIEKTNGLLEVASWSQADNIDVIMDVIKKWIGKLPPSLRIVIDTDARLFLKNSSQPKLQELTDALNKRYPDEKFSISAVKGRRQRGREELARLVKNDLG